MAFDKNNDVLGQIFDFIFAQQELPPSKRKPIEATGIAGDKELVDAVAAVLENPAIFNAKLMADEYSDAVNIKLAELRFSEDNIKKAEVGTSNLADIITDPVGYARKIRDTTKAIRKSMRAKYLGAASTEFVVSAYLRKKGFSKELRDIIKNDIHYRDSVKELYEFSDYKDAEAYAQGIGEPPMLSGADKEYYNARKAKLLPKLAMERRQWEGLTDSQRNDLTKLVLTKNESELRRNLIDMFGRREGDSIFSNYEINKDTFESYSDLELANLDRELFAIQGSHLRDGAWDSEEAELVYERTKLTRDFLEHSDSFKFIAGRRPFDLLKNSRQYMSTLKGHVNDIKSDLRDAKRRGDTDAQRVLKERLKMTKATQRTILQVNIVGNIGKVEGYVNSLRDYWNLQSLINGDFYKSTKNQFYCPTAKVDFEWGMENKKKERYEAVTMAEIMIPEYQDPRKGGERRKLVYNYDEFFANAYYLTPGSIFRTYFYNGEGFAWKAYQQRRKIQAFLAGGSIANFDLRKFSIDREYRERVLNGLEGITNREFLDMLERYSRLGDLTQMFSVLYRAQERVLKWADDNFLKGFRQRVYTTIMKTKMFSNLSDGAVATGLLKTWANKGGLRNLFKGLSHGISEALGIAAGPGLNLIISSVMGWLAERAYDLAVPIFGVIVYAVFGIIGVFYMAYGLTKRNSVKYNISASTPPGAVGYCQSEGTGFYSDPTDEFWGSDILIPAPTDSSCPFGDSGYGCSQGYTNTTCTHKRITSSKPVDVVGVSYFYAPKYCDSSNCTASTVVNPGRCADGNYTGQWVTFNDGNGNVFTLGHTKFIPPSNGTNYSAGEPVAYVYRSAAELIADDPEQRTSGTSFYCWTGSHIHLLVTQNGTPVDPFALLADMGCVNGPSSEAGCPACIGN